MELLAIASDGGNKRLGGAAIIVIVAAFWLIFSGSGNGRR